jgi:aromatic ring-opening dioxygenase LigB subunit
MIALAAIPPHGDIDASPKLREAMEELRRRATAAAVDTAIVLTPHNVHVEGHFAVVVSAKIGAYEVDRELAAAVLEALPLAGLVEAAKADSLWQLLMLQGGVGEDARAELLAYAAPSYYGMLVAIMI